MTLSGRPENDQVSRDIIEAVRRIEDVVAVWDQLGVADDLCTRPHPDDACFTWL